MSEAPKTGQGPGCDRRYSPRLANGVLEVVAEAPAIERLLSETTRDS